MLTEYRRGERLKADDVNALIARAKTEILGVNSMSGLDGGFVGETPRAWQPRTIPVKNVSGHDAPFGAILKPGDTITVGGAKGYEFARQDDEYVWKYLVAVSSSIPDNGYGRAAWLMEGGGTALMSTSASDALEWGPTEDQWYLSPNRPGFFLLEHFGSNLAAVQQQVPRSIIGMAVEQILEDEEGDVEILQGAPGSETGTGIIISDCYNYGPDIDADPSKCTVGLINGHPYAFALKCAGGS